MHYAYCQRRACCAAVSLESRVTVLEQEYLAIHAESRGWAAVAAAADRKASMCAELLTLTYRDVSAIRVDVTTLRFEVTTLKAEVAEHTATLAEHPATLAEHTAILNEHSAKLDEHTAALARIDGTLQEHGDMLRQIPKRLP